MNTFHVTTWKGKWGNKKCTLQVLATADNSEAELELWYNAKSDWLLKARVEHGDHLICGRAGIFSEWACPPSSLQNHKTLWKKQAAPSPCLPGKAGAVCSIKRQEASKGQLSVLPQLKVFTCKTSSSLATREQGSGTALVLDFLPCHHK